MAHLEDERKRELAELVKQREILAQKEQAALQEIQAMEMRVKEQHRAEEQQVQAAIQRLDDGSKGDARLRALRATHMQRSQSFGAKAALLERKRLELQQLQAKIKHDLIHLHTEKPRGDNQTDETNVHMVTKSFNYDAEKRRLDELEMKFEADVKSQAASILELESSSKLPPSASVTGTSLTSDDAIPDVSPPPDPETVKLQQQLDAMKLLKDQREVEMETLRFQQMIQSIQAKLPGAGSNNACNVAPNESMSAQSSSTDLAQKAPDAADEFESKELKALKLKHAEDMLKLKQQRDLMEEEERLQDLKEQRDKRRRDMEEQLAQDEWMANQKRMVMALRMKKMLAQEQPLTASLMTDDMDSIGLPLPYDPDVGFTVFWDYILLVPLKATFLQVSQRRPFVVYSRLGNDLQVTYAVYEGEILRTKHKVLRGRECEPYGPTVNRCVLASSRAFDHLPASQDVRLLIEVAITSTDGKPVSLGWTMLDLFAPSEGSAPQLHEGRFKLPLSHSPMPQMTRGPIQKPDSSSLTDATTLYLRVVHAGHADDAAKYPLPLRLGATLGTDRVDFTSKACDSFMKLPCATLLVRSEDGLSCLSRKDVPEADWAARGIAVPAPAYAEKVYDSTSSRPSLTEDKLYKLRSYRDVPEFHNTDLLVVFDVRGVKQVKGAWVSHQVGWTYLKLLNEAHCIAAGSFQLPVFAGALSLVGTVHDLALDALVALETPKKKGLISYVQGMSVCVRVEDGCMPNTFPKPLVRIVGLTPVGIPPATASKYTYDPAAVAAQQKKKPLGKLVIGKTERDCEKELNIAFAKDMAISHYTF
ncbi:hypothetical protein DYB32_005818 [Aphanomyces invadans]|uniref:Uncharacterized protein n=1 Tax=Aphanomyces invadans TaxID=157072 RepID=A0A3R6Y7C4_9STRA|nr:hypothetical protein DYB32_005818 [Aphanomyces invadans]